MSTRQLGWVLLAAMVLASAAEVRAQGADAALKRPANRAERHEHYLDAYRDQSGRVRADLWLRGMQRAERLPIGRSAAMASPSGFNAAGAWVQIGPQPLRIEDDPSHITRIFQGVGPDSGEVMDIAIDPRGGSDQVVYIATNNGGVWKTSDGGQTWLPKTDQLLSLSMGAVALDPRRPDIVYAGTGNPFDSGALTIDDPFGAAPRFTKGVGIYKSMDGGENWTLLDPFNKGIFNNLAINRIVVPVAPPGSPYNLVLVATNKGLYRSLDGGRTFGSDERAQNLKPVLSGYISDLRADTASPLTIYVAQHGVGIFRSNDGGKTFPTNLFTGKGAPPAGSFGFIAFAQSSLPNGQFIYASVANAANAFPYRATWNGLYRSADRGATWTQMAATLGTGGTPGNDTGGDAAPGNCNCGFDQTIGVDPQNSSRVYLGFQELYLSTDSGAIFTKVSRGNPAPAGTHWDHHALAFSPRAHWVGTPTRLWTGTDGGIHSSSDGGTTWANLNETISTNLIVQIDMGRGSAANRRYTYAGTWDTGTVQHRPEANERNPLAWQSAANGDGGGVAVDTTDPAKAYGSWGGTAISTQDGGKVWTFLRHQDTGWMCAWRHLLDDSGQILFTTSSAFADPAPARRQCQPARGSSVYRKLGAGDVQSIADFSVGFPGISIESIGMAKADPRRLWLGMSDGTLMRSDNPRHNDATKVTWQPTILMTDAAGKNVPHLNTPVGGIAVHPDDPDQLVVVYLGFCGAPCSSDPRLSTQHVFLGTTDVTSGVTTWKDITGDLPDLPTRSVVIDPSSPMSIIVSNDAGVYYTTNQGSSWARLGTGLPRTTASQLAIDTSVTPSVIRTGTYGRSTFELR